MTQDEVEKLIQKKREEWIIADPMEKRRIEAEVIPLKVLLNRKKNGFTKKIF